MTEPLVQEVPLVFDCAGETLVGVVHKPAEPASIGVVTIIAGGPQYRGGVGRAMVSAARELASRGIAVMRFDHRGLGDSSGEFRGFEHIGDDLRAAVTAFRSEVPQVNRVVLWGGCDAASAAMIHGWTVPDAVSLVVGNPWVTTTQTQAIVMRKHYLGRLLQRRFWSKLLRMQYNIADYVSAFFRELRSRAGNNFNTRFASQASDSLVEGGDYVVRMLDGMRRFKGPVLFLMSGQSLLSREFDELVRGSPRWQEVYERQGHQRLDFPNADQTFSDSESREGVNRAICRWVLGLCER